MNLLIFSVARDIKRRIANGFVASSAAIQALGVLGNLLTTKVTDRQACLNMLQRIGEKGLDWKRTNPDWDGVIGSAKGGAVSPASSRQAIDGTIKFLKDRCGLDAYLTK